MGDNAAQQVQSGQWKESGHQAPTWTVQRATAPHPTTTGFVDVAPADQFAGEIEWMRSSGLSTGWPDRTYRPLNNVNRDAVIAFFWRMAGEPAVSAAHGTGFRDVPAHDKFARPITWAKQQGLTTGWATPRGAEFRPTIPIERQAYMAMLHRFCTKFPDRCAANLLKVKPLSGQFSDVPANHQFAADINWGAAAGITTGWPDRSFRGEQPIHRDAIAAFLYRAQHNRVVAQ